MEQHHIVAFLTLAEELHFGRTAERLHTSQPTLSRMIRRLEAELGARLFERTNRKVSLTPSGTTFIDAARALQSAYQTALASVSAAANGLIGTVRLAFSGVASTEAAGQLAGSVLKRYPGITLELLGGDITVDAMEMLLSHRADAVIGYWSTVPAGVSALALREESIVLALPDAHPLSALPSTPLDAVLREPFVDLDSHSLAALGEHGAALRQESDVQVKTIAHVPDSWTALTLVRAGIGVALTPSSLHERVSIAGVRFVELEEETDPLFLRIAWKTRFENPTLRAVLRCSTDIQEYPNRAG